jgi:hypothetical protein
MAGNVSANILTARPPVFPTGLAKLNLLLLLALFAVSSPLNARNIPEFYGQVCANCHGKNPEGSQAPGLLKPELFKHGSDDASIARSISDGYPTNNMVAWKMVLSEPEIRVSGQRPGRLALRPVERPRPDGPAGTGGQVIVPRLSRVSR